MLYLNEYSWVKLLWFRDHCCEANFVENSKDTKFNEVSLMGISKSEENINCIIDLKCVKQEVSSGETIIDDEGLADFFEDMREDKKIGARRCGRVWIHTHPGNSPQPSGTDEETYNRYFKDVDFAVMYILSCGNKDYCRMKYNSVIGPVTQNTGIIIMKGDKYAVHSSSMLSIHDEIEKLKLDYNKILYSKYLKFHESWLKEMQENVSRKKYTHAATLYTGHNNSWQQTYLPSVYKPTGVTTGPQIIDNIIAAIATGGHNLLSDLPQYRLTTLSKECNCNQRDLFSYMSQIKKYEEEFKETEWEGLTNFDGFLNKTFDQQLKIAQLVGVRLGFLRDFFKKKAV